MENPQPLTRIVVLVLWAKSNPAKGDLRMHYNDVKMSTIASQITSLTIIYSTVYSGADQRKQQSFASLAFFAGNSPGIGEFPAQRANDAENVSIWWRHHGKSIKLSIESQNFTCPFLLENRVRDEMELERMQCASVRNDVMLWGRFQHYWPFGFLIKYDHKYPKHLLCVFALIISYLL